MINRNAITNNTGTRNAITPTLQSLFYSSKSNSTPQTSLAYVTTFDTADGNKKITSTKTLYIVVFPVGIHMTSASYQQLILQMRSGNSSITNALLPYYVPLGMRNTERTVKTFTIDKTGNKVPTTTSSEGEISIEQISSCGDSTFKNRFQWFISPPLVQSKSFRSASFNSEKCPYYKTSQYKCVPFDQLHDLSGNNADPQDAYVIPGNVSLQDKLKKPPSNASSNAAFEAERRTTEGIITYGAISVVSIVFIYGIYKVGMHIANS
jgi:hypothetical protein